MTSVIKESGNHGSSAFTGGYASVDSYTFLADDVIAGFLKWEGSTCTPDVRLTGANSGVTFQIGTPVKHASQNMWVCEFLAYNLSAATAEPLEATFQNGVGRPNWAVASWQIRGLKADATPFVSRSTSGYLNAPVSGNSTVTAGGTVNAGDGGIVLAGLCSRTTGVSSFTGPVGYTEHAHLDYSDFIQGAYLVTATASDEQPSATAVGQQLDLQMITMALAAPTVEEPPVDDSIDPPVIINKNSAAYLAAATLPSLVPIIGTGLAGASIDLRIDDTTVLTDVATVTNYGDWTCSIALPAGTHDIEPRQVTDPGETADGMPPTPSAPVINDANTAGTSIRITGTSPGQPWTGANLFRYASASADDADYVQVAFDEGSLDVTIPAVTGYYSWGLQNVNSNGTWYSHKSPRVFFDVGGFTPGNVLTPADTGVVIWTPPTLGFSSPTDGRYQIDKNGDHNDIPTDSGAGGAVHVSDGITHPDGGYAFRLTSVGGKRRWYHRIGPGLQTLNTITWRAELGGFGEEVTRGQRFLYGTILRPLSTLLQAGAPFVSLTDMHLKSDASPAYGGAGPCGIWGDRFGWKIYTRRGNGGVWDSGADHDPPNTNGPITRHQFTPVADTEYYVIFDGLQHNLAGNGAYLKVWLGTNDGDPVQVVDYVGTFGTEITKMYWKVGMYGFMDSFPSLATPRCELYSGGQHLLVGPSAQATYDRMYATLRAIV